VGDKSPTPPLQANLAETAWKDVAVEQTRSKARLVWVLIPAVAFVGLLFFAITRQGDAPGLGDAAPDFTAPLLIGDGTLALEDLRGRPVVLNFWASWCEPCEDEAPMLQRAWQQFGDRVAFVGVDIRDAKSDALEFVDEYGLQYAHVRDERLVIYDDYGLTGQPETFFIDHEGVIVEHINGPISEDVLFQLLDLLVARSA
jgi:cytochrome c biogenesis protein CcmG/thiol:disulfide interchange protein DsbE